MPSRFGRAESPDGLSASQIQTALKLEACTRTLAAVDDELVAVAARLDAQPHTVHAPPSPTLTLVSRTGSGSVRSYSPPAERTPSPREASGGSPGAARAGRAATRLEVDLQLQSLTHGAEGTVVVLELAEALLDEPNIWPRHGRNAQLCRKWEQMAKRYMGPLDAPGQAAVFHALLIMASSPSCTVPELADAVDRHEQEAGPSAGGFVRWVRGYVESLRPNLVAMAAKAGDEESRAALQDKRVRHRLHSSLALGE